MPRTPETPLRPLELDCNPRPLQANAHMLTIAINQPVQWTTEQPSELNPQNTITVYHRGVIADATGHVIVITGLDRKRVLVKHSHTGQLELIDTRLLENLPIRTD